MSVVSDKYRGTTDYVLLLAHLVRAAQYRALTTYQDIAFLMGLAQSRNHMAKEIGLLLGAIAEDEFDAGRPMLSAVAVGVSGKPGPGFFDLARQLGRLDPNDDEGVFWENERGKAYKTWRRPLP